MDTGCTPRGCATESKVRTKDKMSVGLQVAEQSIEKSSK